MILRNQRLAALWKRVLPICEVLVVLTIFMVIGKLFFGKPFRRWQVHNFGYCYLTNLLFLFVPPLMVLLLTRRSPNQIGLAFGQLKKQSQIGLVGGFMLVLLAGWPFPVVELIGSSYRQWMGASILTVVELVVLFPVVHVISSRPNPVAGTGSRRQIVLFMLTAIMAFTLGAGAFKFSKHAAGLVYMFFFVGFGEELFHRGYIQSRLNDAFGRPYHFFGIQWGLGLIFAAILFGLCHALPYNAPRPWPWALWTTAVGITLGMLREKTGSIVAPAIAHGLYVLPTVFFE